MFKIIIFFIFSLIMLKISWSDIETETPVIAVSRSPEQNMKGNSSYLLILYIFKELVKLFKSLYSHAMTLPQILTSETHGRKFYRFFAFEFFFILVLANLGLWLRNPFIVFRIFTWIILLSSFVIAVCGVHHLLRSGKPQTKNEFLTTNDITVTTFYQLLSLSFDSYIGQYIRNPRMLLGIEKTTCLVTSGIYKYIRHPIYSAIILLGAVTLLKNDFPWLALICLFIVATVFLYATARIEEKENLLKFGEDYAVYMERTNMFIPFL